MRQDRRRGAHPTTTTTVPNIITTEIVNSLAVCADWRQAVEDLGLSERDARALRVAIVRRRAFGTTRRT